MAELSKKEQIYNEVEKENKTVINSVMFFALANPLLQKINRGLIFANSQIAKLETNIVSLNVPSIIPIQDTTQQPNKPVAEEKESVSVSKSAFTASGLAALAFALPFLINKESRDYLTSFIAGLIGTDALDKIALALKLVGAALAAAFAYKTMQQIQSAFESIKRLSKLTATLFGLTSDGTDAVNEKEDDLKKKQKQIKENQQKYKKSRDKAKKAERARRRANRLARAEKLKKIKSVKDTISKLKKVLLIGGPIGIAAGIVGGIAIGTMIDLIAGPSEEAEVKENELDRGRGDEGDSPTTGGDEDEELVVEDIPDEEPELEPAVAESNITPEKVGTTLADNAVQELSMGFFDMEGVKKTFRWARSKLFGGGEENKNVEKAPPTSAPTAITTTPSAPTSTPDEGNQTALNKASTTSNVDQDAAQALATGTTPNAKLSALPTSSPASTPSESPGKSGSSITSSITPSVQPIIEKKPISESTTGAQINEGSEEVIAAKKDEKQGSVMINSIDNSTNVFVNNEERSKEYQPQVYSTIHA